MITIDDNMTKVLVFYVASCYVLYKIKPDIMFTKDGQFKPFGVGKEKSIQFWHSIIRQVYVKQLLTKEIESYGVLKVTKSGLDFIKTPTSFMITEDHDYNSLSNQKVISNQKGHALDGKLYNILKDLRKQQAKSIGLPPSILFMEPSLIDMANQYPITLEELSQIQGVGVSKAKKYGQIFIDFINI